VTWPPEPKGLERARLPVVENARGGEVLDLLRELIEEGEGNARRAGVRETATVGDFALVRYNDLPDRPRQRHRRLQQAPGVHERIQRSRRGQRPDRGGGVVLP